jgi:hypothetical protein
MGQRAREGEEVEEEMGRNARRGRRGSVNK